MVEVRAEALQSVEINVRIISSGRKGLRQRILSSRHFGIQTYCQAKFDAITWLVLKAQTISRVIAHLLATPTLILSCRRRSSVPAVFWSVKCPIVLRGTSEEILLCHQSSKM
jgi:hypothetical protein